MEDYKKQKKKRIRLRTRKLRPAGRLNDQIQRIAVLTTILIVSRYTDARAFLTTTDDLFISITTSYARMLLARKNDHRL